METPTYDVNQKELVAYTFYTTCYNSKNSNDFIHLLQ